MSLSIDDCLQMRATYSTSEISDCEQS